MTLTGSRDEAQPVRQRRVVDKSVGNHDAVLFLDSRSREIRAGTGWDLKMRRRQESQTDKLESPGGEKSSEGGDLRGMKKGMIRVDR